MTYYWPMPALSWTTFDGRFYDQIFAPDFFERLATLMGTEHTKEGFESLRFGHFQAFGAFSTGQFERDHFQVLNAENARLEQVAKDAEKLFHSLEALYAFGQTHTKLTREIERNPTQHIASNRQTLAAMKSTDRPENPLYDFKAFLSDLSVSARRAVISKPKPIDPIGKDFDFNALEALVLTKDLTSTGNHATEMDLGRKRSAAHRLSKNHAVSQFVETFGPVWAELSPFPFTQGHYYEKIGHEPSRAVEALQLSFSCHAPNVSIQNIVTAIRKFQSPA